MKASYSVLSGDHFLGGNGHLYIQRRFNRNLFSS